MLSRRALLGFPAAFWLMSRSSLFAAPLAPVPAWPGQEWDTTTLERAGWDTEVMAEARGYSQGIGTNSFMVIQHGVVVDSWGETDQRIELHSIRKSLLSALVGIAVADGKISLDATLASLDIDDNAPALTATERQATVRQLLQARSGVYHPALYETSGEKRRRPARESHAPGTFWYYNNWDFNALGTIYERATGTSIFEAFQQHIAMPLGMQDYWPSDGRYVRGADSMHPAYPLRMTARDLARFGLLFLRSGRWRDAQVVPSGWVRDSTAAYSETHLRSGYGYLWWTGFPDRRFPLMDLSPGGFWADGYRGQYVVVDPVNDLVVVHQTARGNVSERQMGHLMWLLLRACRIGDPGADPLSASVP